MFKTFQKPRACHCIIAMDEERLRKRRERDRAKRTAETKANS